MQCTRHAVQALRAVCRAAVSALRVKILEDRLTTSRRAARVAAAFRLSSFP
jgi:hypothetical protein